MEDRALVRHNRPFLFDESHDPQALFCVGLEGWDDEMMEGQKQRSKVRVLFLTETANCCEEFSRDLGWMPGEFLSGRLLAFQLVCVAEVTQLLFVSA